MINGGRRHEPGLPPKVPRATTEIRLFKVTLEVVIEEKSCILNDFAPNHHHRALGRSDPARGKRRRASRLPAMKMALQPPRHHQSATIIQTIVQCRNIHRSLNNAHARIVREKIHQRSERIGPHYRIIVQEENVISRTKRKSKIIAACEPKILFGRDIFCVSIGGDNQSCRFKRSIIHHYDFRRLPIHRRKRSQTISQQTVTIPRHNQYGNST